MLRWTCKKTKKSTKVDEELESVGLKITLGKTKMMKLKQMSNGARDHSRPKAVPKMNETKKAVALYLARGRQSVY